MISGGDVCSVGSRESARDTRPTLRKSVSICETSEHGVVAAGRCARGGTGGLVVGCVAVVGGGGDVEAVLVAAGMRGRGAQRAHNRQRSREDGGRNSYESTGKRAVAGRNVARV